MINYNIAFRLSQQRQNENSWTQFTNLPRPENVRHQEVHQRPELHQIILQWGACTTNKPNKASNNYENTSCSNIIAAMMVEGIRKRQWKINDDVLEIHNSDHCRTIDRQLLEIL